jgi:thiol-disulfide isomerase/thioredoxin
MRDLRGMANSVLVFHQGETCSACSEYLPRFRKLAEPYKSKIDIRSINLNKSDKLVQDAGQKFKIKSVPTTIVIGADDKVLRKVIGNIDNASIAKLLAFAAGR